MAENKAKNNPTGKTEPSHRKAGGAAAKVYVRMSRHLFLYSIVLVVILTTGGYMFILRPKYDDIKTKIDEANQAKQAELEDLNSYHAKLVKYLEDYESIEEKDKKTINAILPKDPEREKLFTSLEAIVKNENMILASLKIADQEAKVKKGAEDEVKDKGVEKIRVTMAIIGVDYAGLKRLLAALENSLNLIDVDKIVWSPTESSVTLEADTYYLK